MQIAVIIVGFLGIGLGFWVFQLENLSDRKRIVAASSILASGLGILIWSFLFWPFHGQQKAGPSQQTTTNVNEKKPSPTQQNEPEKTTELNPCDKENATSPVEVSPDRRGEIILNLTEACFGKPQKFPEPLSEWTIAPISAQGEFWVSFWPEGKEPTPKLTDTTQIGGQTTIARFKGRGTLLFQSKKNGNTNILTNEPAQPATSFVTQVGLAKIFRANLTSPSSTTPSARPPEFPTTPETSRLSRDRNGESLLATKFHNHYGIKYSTEKGLNRFVISRGGMNSGLWATDGGYFAAFGDDDQGNLVAFQNLRVNFRNETVRSTLNSWTHDGGYVTQALAILTAKGVSPNARIQNLSDGQIEMILDQIDHGESRSSGGEYYATNSGAYNPIQQASQGDLQEADLQRHFTGFDRSVIPCNGSWDAKEDHSRENINSIEVVLRPECFSPKIMLPRDWVEWTIGPEDIASRNGWLMAQQEGHWNPRPGGPYPLSDLPPIMQLDYGRRYQTGLPATIEWFRGVGKILLTATLKR